MPEPYLTNLIASHIVLATGPSVSPWEPGKPTTSTGALPALVLKGHTHHGLGAGPHLFVALNHPVYLMLNVPPTELPPQPHTRTLLLCAQPSICVPGPALHGQTGLALS